MVTKEETSISKGDSTSSLKVSMLNSIETNRELISRSYTDFKTSPTLELISKSYNNFTEADGWYFAENFQNYYKYLIKNFYKAKQEAGIKSLYDYESVRKILSDLDNSKRSADFELSHSKSNHQLISFNDEEANNLFSPNKPNENDNQVNMNENVSSSEIKQDIRVEEEDRYDFLYKTGKKSESDLDDETSSNNTSYQELPSICSKTNKVEDAEQIKVLNLTKTENNMSVLDKVSSDSNKDSNKPLASKFVNLNSSLQSLTSQCTIDSLAKRVQKLVGPVDYNKHQTDYYSSPTSKLMPSVSPDHKHSLMNYDSIYKELDNIQDTLRGQNRFNRHLEDLAAVNPLDKLHPKIHTYLDTSFRNEKTLAK